MSAIVQVRRGHRGVVEVGEPRVQESVVKTAPEFARVLLLHLVLTLWVWAVSVLGQPPFEVEGGGGAFGAGLGRSSCIRSLSLDSRGLDGGRTGRLLFPSGLGHDDACGQPNSQHERARASRVMSHIQCIPESLGDCGERKHTCRSCGDAHMPKLWRRTRAEAVAMQQARPKPAAQNLQCRSPVSVTEVSCLVALQAGSFVARRRRDRARRAVADEVRANSQRAGRLGASDARGRA